MELRLPPLVQVLLVGAGMLFLSKLMPFLNVLIPANMPVGIAVVVGGVIVALAGVLEFRKSNTTVDPRYPQRSEKLVTTGIYKTSRNPMYLGFLFMLLGWCLILANFASFLFLPVFVFYINHFQIKPEERFLLQKFGSGFAQYCNRVRRWV